MARAYRVAQVLSLVHERDTVANAEQAHIDSLVLVQLCVQFLERHRVRVRFARVRDPTRPEHVVDDDQSAWPEELQYALVVPVVVGFVRINERIVVRSGLARLDQAVESPQCRLQSQVNLVIDARLFPVAPADRCPFLADVAGDDFSVLWQCQRHDQRGVSSEYSDLDAALRLISFASNAIN